MEGSKCYPGAKVQCHLRFNWECQPRCAPISEGCAQREMGSNFWQGLPLWGDDYKRLRVLQWCSKGSRSLPITATVKYTWFKLNAYFDDRRNKSIEQLNSGKKWTKYALNIFMRNKAKTENDRVMRLSTQQQSYQVDTPHNPRTAGHGDHTHAVNLLQRTCTCQKWKLYKIPCSHVIAICIRYRHDAEQYIDPCYSMDAYVGAMLPFSLHWKIDDHGRILKKLERSSLTPINSRERSPCLNTNQEWDGRGWESAENHTMEGGGKEGAMRVLWPRGA